MKQLESHRGFEASAWRSMLLSLEGGPYHLPEVWLTECPPERLVHLVLRSAGRPLAAVIGLADTGGVLGRLRGRSRLYLPVAPAAAPGSVAERSEIYEPILEFARSRGFSSVGVDPRWGEDFTDDGRYGVSIDRRLVEFVIDLRPAAEEIRRAVHKTHRKNIRRAESHGLALGEVRDEESFLVLRKLQMSSSERAAGRNNGYGVRSEGDFRRLYRHVYRAGPGRVLLALEQGEPVAALAYLSFGGRAVTVRSGANAKGYESGAMYLLQSELIARLKAEGVRELNIGGVSAGAADQGHPEHGLYVYKSYWGGKPCRRTGLHVPL